jgi:radical SAM superfamily enzyme YgiQ (UPF0313 family)
MSGFELLDGQRAQRPGDRPDNGGRDNRTDGTSARVDIVLVRCRILTDRQTGVTGKFGGQINPPFGVLYIQSYLRKAGFNAVIMDRYDDRYIDLTTDQFIEQAHRLKPRFIGFSAMARYSKLAYPEVPVILGGVHYSSLPATGAGYADYVVRGDGEIATLEILRGEQQCGVIQGKLVSVDDVPFPSIDDFRATGYRAERASNLKLITARGCPFDCYFCKDGYRGSAVRHHSVEYVGEMFRSMLDGYSFHNTIFIMDDIFLPTEQRLHAYIAEFRRLGLKPRLDIFFHPNTVKERLLPLFWELGVRTISIGVESGSQAILDSMGKNTIKAGISDSVRLLRDYGFWVNGLFILGHRGETPETLRATLDYSRALPLNSAWFSYMVPFPGTPVWDEGIERHGTILDWNMAEWGNVKPIFLPADLTLEQLTASMDEALEIRKEISARSYNRILSFRHRKNALLTRLRQRRYVFLERLRRRAA